MRTKKLIAFIKTNRFTFFLILLLFPLYFILYKIYIPRVNAFGCFDDCNNFMRGYFVLQGKELFSEVFSGHQPLGSYLSTVIQFVTTPQNIFELILRHRQFVLIFGFIFNIALILRFGSKIILFTAIFELTKFYLFGDRFLGDSMIIYPISYLTGLILLKFTKQKLLTIDYYAASLFTWFIIFMREPYIPLALLAFFIIIWDKPLRQVAKISAVLFLILSFITVFSHDVGEYFFNVVIFNYQINLPSEISANMIGNRFTQALFYPIYIFFYGNMNILKQILLLIDALFLINIFVLLKNKAYKLTATILVLLALANIRVVVPGTTFYSAFHMLVWYGLFIFITIWLTFNVKKSKSLLFILAFAIFSIFINIAFNPAYFARDKVDQHTELLTNYGEVMQIGAVIRSLSKPGDTLFLDGSDDIIYWVAKLDSPYKYSWYTSAMPIFSKYTDARIQMFKTNPPTFYKEFGSCPKKVEVNETYRLPDFIKDKYVRLYNLNKPSCLFVRKDKIKQITNAQWKRARESLFSIDGRQ